MKLQKKVKQLLVMMFLSAICVTFMATSQNNDTYAGEIIQDDLQAIINSGTWSNSGATNEYNGQSRYTNNQDGSAYYEFNIVAAGDLPVDCYLRWSTWPNRSNQVILRVREWWPSDNAWHTRTSTLLNQSVNGGKFNKVFTTSGGTGATKIRIAQIHNDSSERSTCIDAAKVSWGGGGGSTCPALPSNGIMDNGSQWTSSTATWQSSGGANPYGGGSLYSNTLASYTYCASGVNGSKQVSLWWTEYSNRCSTVYVDIFDGNTLLDTVNVNQQANGGKWNSLGTYSFSGEARVIIVSQGGCTTSADACKIGGSDPPPTSCPTIPSDGIMDNGSQWTSSTGTWQSSGGANPYGGGSIYSNTSGSYTYCATGVNGSKDVSLWWTEYSNRCSTVWVDIFDGNTLLDTVNVNQQANGGKWNSLGTYSFSGTARVVINAQGGCTTSADACKITSSTNCTQPDLVVESINYTPGNPSPGQQVTVEVTVKNQGCAAAGGFWIDWYADSASPPNTTGDLWEGIGLAAGATYTMSGQFTYPAGCFDSWAQVDVAQIVTESNEGNNILGPQEICVGSEPCPTLPSNGIMDNGSQWTSSMGTWQPSGGANPYGGGSLYSSTLGSYIYCASGVNGSKDVSLWWTEFSNRCDNVPVDIYDGNTLLDTVYVNQQENGGQWNYLGTYPFSGGITRVVIRTQGGCTTSADACKIGEATPCPFIGNPYVGIMDNGSPWTSSTGTWLPSSGTPYIGNQSVYSNEAGATYTYCASGLVHGVYKISLLWTYWGNRCTSVPVDIYDGNTLLTTVNANQQIFGSQWVGVYAAHFYSGVAKVVIRAPGGCTTSTDAAAIQLLQLP